LNGSELPGEQVAALPLPSGEPAARAPDAPHGTTSSEPPPSGGPAAKRARDDDARPIEEKRAKHPKNEEYEDEDEDEPEDEDEDEPVDDEDETGDDEDDDAPESASAGDGESKDPAVAAGTDLTEEHVWSSTARSVLLAGALGFAVATWLQFSFGARWANELLAKNVLPEGQRSIIIKASIGGAALAALIVGYLIWAGLRKRRDPARIERWLWFLSPLLLTPALGWLFRFKPWLNEHARLLPIVLLLSLVLEVAIFQSLKACPERVRSWFEELREQVPPLVRRHGPLAIVALGSLFYIFFFCFFLLRWHYKLKTGNFDLSINNNLMFGGLHGRFLESPVVFPQDPPKYLANHAKFGGYLFLPIYALFPRPETLLVIQSTLIGLSALPLWGFARRHVSEWATTLIAVAYLLYYPMHGASFSEFQYVPIAGFFVLTTVWAAETRRWVVFWVVFVTGILMREDMPIGMAVVGLFLLVSGHRPVQGLVMAAIAGAYFCILRFYVMEEAGQWWFPNMYKELWADGEKGFRSVIKTLLSNPLYVVSKIVVEKKLIYLLHLLVPLAFLPVRRWYLWAAFLPGTLLTLLITNYDPPITFSFHYVMHWTPYLFLACVLALKSIGEQPVFGVERRRAALAAMLGATLVLTYNYGAFAMRDGSFRGGFHKVDFGVSEAEEQRYRDLQSLIAMIPKDAAVAATEKLGPHVSSRVEMYTMRHGPQKAEWVLASSRELKLSRTKPKLLEALRSGDYGVVKRIGDLALIKRGHDTAENERLIRDWRLVEPRPREREREPRKEAEPKEPKEPEQKEPEPEPEPEGRAPEPTPG
jgi:uncharacterized membrane protein